MKNDLDLYQPEKLSLWDRWFNRYKKVPFERGIDVKEIYDHTHNYENPLKTTYRYTFIIYHIIDRLTGGYSIKKEFLDTKDFPKQ